MFGPHFNIAFLGGGGNILSEPGFRGKYSKITYTTCIFLNIFVEDCSIFTIDFEYYLSHICAHTISQRKNVEYIAKHK